MEPTAVVTGAARGIGKAIVHALLKAGYRVFFCDLDEEAGKKTEEELSEVGTCRFLPGDVADEARVESLMETAARTFGPITLLVNNAALSANGPLADLSTDAWNRVLAANLTGPMLCAKHAAPRMAAGASIVNICSTRAHMSEPGTEAYSASKGGLLALTHALAASLGPKIRVNAISPGWIDTREWSEGEFPPLTEEDHAQHPAGRVGRPEDVASLVLWLADPAQGFVTGQEFTIDGGMTRKMIYL